MRKALLPMIASLALCGTATAALIVTNAHADNAIRRPLMIALGGAADIAGAAAAPRAEGGPPSDMMRPDAMHEGPSPEMMAAHRGQMCRDMYARKAGEMAFLEAKLALTPAQTPLFAHWKTVSMDIAHQHEAGCSTRMRPAKAERDNVVDRLAMEETMLKKRLADIGAERPALDALYASLTPTQRTELGHGDMRRMAGRMGMMMGMMGRPHRGDMGPPRGEMGPPHMGPQGEGRGPDAPPPPPQ